MGVLKNKILSYSPEYYFTNETAYTSTTVVNYGTTTTNATWTQTGANPGFNSTGGPDSSGCWQFSTNNASEQSLRSFGSVVGNNTPYGVTMDGDYSAGAWFRIPAQASGNTETNLDIVRFGGNNTGTQVSMPLTGSLIGKLSFGNPTTIYTTNRYDDGLWHYYAERMYVSGANFIKERYIDGSLFGTVTITATSPTLWYAVMGDNSIINAIASPTFTEIAHYYIAPYSSIDATAIAEIYNIGITGGATNISYSATPATATALMTDPTIAVTTGDHVEITTSITASAIFPSAIAVEAIKNINNVITEVLTASTIIGDNVTISTGVDASYSTTSITATALLVEPVLPVPAMTASAISGDHSVYVTPSYYSLVKSLNPVFYTQLDDPTITNEGSWTISSITKGSTVSTEVASTGDLGLIGSGQSWKMTGNYNNAPNYIRVAPVDPSNTIYNLEQTKNFSIEYWFKPIDQYSAGIGVDFGSFRLGYDRSNKTMYVEAKQTTPGWDNPTDAIAGTSYSRYRVGNSDIITIGDWNYVALVLNGDTLTVYVNNTFFSLPMTLKTWDPINISYMRFFASELDYVISGNGYGGSYAGQTYEKNTVEANTLLDQLVIYPNALTNSQVIDHYSFIYNQSPDRNINVLPLTANSESGNHQYTVTSNVNFAATTITASSLLANPLVIAIKTINYSTTALTASAQNTNVTVYWGWTIYATPATAYAEKPATYFLNSTYFDYVQANIAPYRYVSFDDANPYIDFGTDNDYSVVPVSINGTVVNPDLGINGKSVKTSGITYAEGVILRESEWNDSWGTGQNSYHSAFWFQRAIDDASTTGLRVLWNLNGYKDNQHVILYQYQDKLHMQFNNGSGTWIEQDTTNGIDLFDYQRHFVVIEFDHSNVNNNTVRLYVDAALKMTVNLGSYTGSTTNAASADSGPNNEINNHPRLGFGCLITPFASTALPVVPTNTKLIIDEVYWDKDSISSTMVVNLFNTMPDKTNKNIIAELMTASDELVMPAFATSSVLSTIPATASVEVIEPLTTADREVVYATTVYDVTAQFPAAKVFENKIITSDVFIATAIFNDAGVRITIPGGPFIANATLANNYTNGITVYANTFPVYLSVYNMSSPWAAWLRATEVEGIYPTKEVV